jgi:mutator protein MutT
MRSLSHPAPAEIVVGFVVRDGRFLVGRREGDPGLEGTWELPGGKVAPGEDHASALAREVREETGLEIEVGERLCALCHVYPDRRVALHAYLCTPLVTSTPVLAFTRTSAPGVASRDDSTGRWVGPDDYFALSMPAANPSLVDAFAWSVSQHGSTDPFA